MSKLLAVLGLLGTFTGVAINYGDIEALFLSNEFTPEQKEYVATETANQLENTYNKLLNGEAVFGKHFCN